MSSAHRFVYVVGYVVLLVLVVRHEFVITVCIGVFLHFGRIISACHTIIIEVWWYRVRSIREKFGRVAGG